jgi:ABC-type amino acid transport substrate-binding protein
MKNFLLVILAVALTLVIQNFVWPHHEANQSQTETTYERVLRTHTLRVGYINFRPNSIVDPNSHEITGIFPDLLRQIGQVTGLTVEFTEEVGLGNLIEGLETGRYDITSGFWVNPERARMTTVSVPVYYSGMSIWARPDSFFSPDNNWASLNTKNVKIGAIDGSTIMHIIHSNFPEAALISYPNLTPETQLFEDLVDKKIDVFFVETSQGLIFLKSNPGKVVNISGDHPFRLYGNALLIDAAIAELQGSGVVDALIDKYEVVPGSYYRAAKPYIAPSPTH